MRIVWAQNPLRTVVELDDGDRWWLREAMQEDMDPDDTQHLAWMNRLHDAYIAALRDIHVGDCTCIPCSCLKCHAEDLLGIDTLAGLGKHEAHKIVGAFGHGRTIDEAIVELSSYDPMPSSPMWDGKRDIWDAHVPRWREEAARAHTWLVAYLARTVTS